MELKEFRKNKLAIVEIFNSISGEGLSAGELVTFVRVAGCNLRCSYCDSTYSYQESDGQHKRLKPKEILKQVNNFASKKIICTGGEPLVENEAKRYLPLYLTAQGFKVRIESNGSMPVYSQDEFDIFGGEELRENLAYTLDVKSPSSAMAEQNIYRENFTKLGVNDELKFVVANKNDFEHALKVLEEHQEILAPNKVTINFSPVFNQIEAKELVKLLKSRQAFFVDKQLKLRLSLQIHKMIWDAEQKGV